MSNVKTAPTASPLTPAARESLFRAMSLSDDMAGSLEQIRAIGDLLCFGDDGVEGATCRGIGNTILQLCDDVLNDNKSAHDLVADIWRDGQR